MATILAAACVIIATFFLAAISYLEAHEAELIAQTDEYGMPTDNGSYGRVDDVR